MGRGSLLGSPPFAGAPAPALAPAVAPAAPPRDKEAVEEEIVSGDEDFTIHCSAEPIPHLSHLPPYLPYSPAPNGA